jgi:VanZ family protein
MGVISVFSTDAFSHEETGRLLLPLLRFLFPRASAETLSTLHTAIRKGMHVAEFGVLALLWYRTLAWGGESWQTRAAGVGFLLAAGFAVLDEAHQTFTSTRGGSLVDVGWDSLGAALGLMCRRAFRR